MLPSTMERIRGLSPAHQMDVHNIVSGKCILKGKFNSQMDEERATLLYAFERYASWTIPSVFPPDDITGYEEVQYDYQSLGAQAVNSLANKIVMTLFHPSRPFFRGKLTPEQRAQFGVSKNEAAVQMSKIEQSAILEFAKVNGRPAVTQLMMSMVVTGNGLLITHKNMPYRTMTYRNYACTYDTYGKIVELVTRECLVVNTLSDEMASAAARMGRKPDDQVEIFTGVKRIKAVNGTSYYVVWQELEDYVMMADGYGVYSEDTLPFKPQRWMTMPGRNAGIGPVELMAGDFHTLSTLAETDIDLMALITDIKTFVDPQGYTKIEEIVEKPPGAVVAGREEDVHSHVHDIKQQSQYIDTKEQKVAKRIAQVFLMASSVTRDAERVTAEEIRYLANELDQAHGGVYSSVARSLQYPIAKDLLSRMNHAFKGIEPIIVTGLESLSRQSELDNYRGFIGDLANAANVPPNIAAWLSESKLIQKFASGWGINHEDVLFTQAEKDANDAKNLRMMQAQAAAQSSGQAQGDPNVPT